MAWQRRAARSEPIATFVRTPEGEIFCGLTDLMGVDGEEDESVDEDKASAEAYILVVQECFKALGISWEEVEDRLRAVVSDGAKVMEAMVNILNERRAKRKLPPIKWVRDAAHCLVRVVATAKKGNKAWYSALDTTVAFLASFYRVSAKRMRGLWRNGARRSERFLLHFFFAFFMSSQNNWVGLSTKFSACIASSAVPGCGGWKLWGESWPWCCPISRPSWPTFRGTPSWRWTPRGRRGPRTC